jgi:hypothetical protein
VTHGWIRAVRDKLESGSTQHETTRVGLQQRLCMLAVTCFSTFDVCPEHIPALLCDDKDFSVAMQCAIIVHDNTPLRSDDNSMYLTKMLGRHRRLLHDLEPIFLQSDPTANPDQTRLLHAAYDHALSQEWSDLRRSSRWQQLPRLLIDGKQLGRVPREIIEHPTYTSVLGTVSGRSHIIPFFHLFLRHFQKVFDVVPADVPGMDYKTQLDMAGYKVRHRFSWACRSGGD